MARFHCFSFTADFLCCRYSIATANATATGRIRLSGFSARILRSVRLLPMKGSIFKIHQARLAFGFVLITHPLRSNIVLPQMEASTNLKILVFVFATGMFPECQQLLLFSSVGARFVSSRPSPGLAVESLRIANIVFPLMEITTIAKI